jgi:hypothetical protein
MRRSVRGLSIDVCQFFVRAELQAQLPTCAVRGEVVAGTSTYPSIPNTTVNVIHPKRPSWISPKPTDLAHL